MMSLSTIKAAKRQINALRQETLSCGATGDHLALQVALDCMDQCIKALEDARAEAQRNEWLEDMMYRARSRVLGTASCVQEVYVIGGAP